MPATSGVRKPCRMAVALNESQGAVAANRIPRTEEAIRVDAAAGDLEARELLAALTVSGFPLGSERVDGRQMRDRIGCYLRQQHLALLALIVALSGTAYAATKVGPDEITKNAVRAKHIKTENVGGKDLRCPGNMKLRGGLCFEQTARTPANWDDALEQCASQRRRLPTVAEALLAIETFPTPPSQDNYWTSDSTHRDEGDNQFSAFVSNLAAGTLDVGYAGQFNSNAYICVTSAGA